MAELVGLQAQAPDVMGKLSQLLTIRHQQQALAGQAAEVASVQQSQRQRAALAKYDFNQHLGDDGTIDLNSLSTDPELRVAAGDQYLEVLSYAANAKQQQLEAKSKLFNLRSDQVQALGQMLTPLLSDKDVADDNEKGRQKVNEAWMQYGQLYGDEALPVLKTYAAPLRNAPPGKMEQALRMIQMQALDVEKQRQARLPVLVNRGGSLVNVNPDVGTGAPTDIPLTLPPGATIVTDQKGAQFVLNPQTNQLTPVGTGRGGAPAPNAAPNQPTFTQPTYVGQEHDIQTQQQEVQNIRTTADAAPLNRSIYRHILQLADDTATGPGVAFLQKNPIIGQMFGDNYQELTKYLEKNAIANMTAMGGPPSDARLEANIKASGSTHFNAKALKAVTQFNYASNTGIEKYRQGIDKAVGIRNPDYSKLPQFKSEWSKNFDIDAFRLENAIADGDEKAKNEILNGLTKQQAASLMKKMRNLDSLAATGHLPNE